MSIFRGSPGARREAARGAIMYLDAEDYRRYVEASYEHERKLIQSLGLKEKI